MCTNSTLREFTDVTPILVYVVVYPNGKIESGDIFQGHNNFFFTNPDPRMSKYHPSNN